MKKFDFRQHQIRRSCNKKYENYHSYLGFLLDDFSHRCCYCNTAEKTLDIVSFQIDHFIPQSHFKGIRDELLTQYDNLMLSCPKCNRAKSDQYEGNINSPFIENTLFYNPVEVDYNTIFYRNELGGISSDDEKGKNMIKRLKLYRPLHNYAWVLEKLDELIDRLDIQIERTEGEKKEQLEALQRKLLREQRKKRAIFVAAYRNNK